MTEFNALADARQIIRSKQFGMADTQPIVWQSLQRTLDYIDAQQKQLWNAIKA